VLSSQLCPAPEWFSTLWTVTQYPGLEQSVPPGEVSRSGLHGVRNKILDLGDMEDTDEGTVERPKYCCDVQGDRYTDPSRKHALIPLVSLRNSCLPVQVHSSMYKCSRLSLFL